MSRSLSTLRRGLLGIAFVGTMGFGATQAFAAFYWVPIAATCNRYDPSAFEYCTEKCHEAGYPGGGQCSYRGGCQCWVSPMGEEGVAMKT